jgi:pyruvoyl-dependent arginine decarboxylase (PvlArgDC)
MNKINGLLTLALLMNAIMSSAVQAASDEDEQKFGAWCSNKEIWQPFGVTREHCMTMAIECDKELKKQNLTLMQISEEIYTCVFNKAGINFSAVE